MSNRLPENETPFRLIDPIVEEYRLTLVAYKQMLVDALLSQWVILDRPGTPSDFLTKRIGEILVSCVHYGCFDGGLQGEIPVVPTEILDQICKEWLLPPFEQFCAEFAENDNPDLPDVFKDIFS